VSATLRYVSTRGAAPPTELSAALAAGLAPDGGLFVPERLPRLARSDFDAATTLPETASTLLRPFFVGDRLQAELDAICREAYDFEAPLQRLDATTRLLELFHGPTAAFKDYGARFLAACLRRLRDRSDPRPTTILVATSGDTGAAVGGAFDGLDGLRVVILYPDGRVSPRQAHQLGAFGANVRALRMAGSFDDCQALVKRALNDTALQREIPLSSANSISLGRWLPQMAYYVHAGLQHQRATGRLPDFVIPTGNLGNALAAIFARALGAPLGGIALATNANDVLPQFFAGVDYTPRASVATLANAMDVGAPSNFERLRWLYPEASALRAAFRATAVDDAQIRASIRRTWDAFGIAICPHTATAMSVREMMRAASDREVAVVATAHPAKFETIVEPLIGTRVAPPPALAALLARPSHSRPIAADYDALRRELCGAF
jgi:threonine synthase